MGLAAHLGKDENLVYFQVICYPFIGIIGNDTCPAVATAVERIIADPSIRTVILSNYWAMRIRDKKIRLESEPENRDRVQIFEKLLKLTLEKLIRADKEIIFDMGVPDLDFPPEACLPSRPLAISERLPGKDCSISRASVEARAGGYLSCGRARTGQFPRSQALESVSQTLQRDKLLGRFRRQATLQGRQSPDSRCCALGD